MKGKKNKSIPNSEFLHGGPLLSRALSLSPISVQRFCDCPSPSLPPATVTGVCAEIMPALSLKPTHEYSLTANLVMIIVSTQTNLI